MDRNESKEAMLPEGMGFCLKHSQQFVLTEGCPQCLAEKAAMDARGIVREGLSEGIAAKVDHELMEDAALIPQAGGDMEVINYYSQAVKLKEYAESRVIKTLDDLKTAADDMTLIARLKKAMEEKRKESLKPHQDKVKEISDNFKFLMEPVEAANQVTRAKIGAFNEEQEERRRKQEEINRKRLEAAQEEAALNGGEISEPVNLVEVTEPTKRVSNEMGGIGMVDSWKWEVTSFAAVPDAFKVIDSSQLTAIARKHHDQKPVPGVRFYNEPTVRVSTK